uniref:Uncharacterized protein n=1 Tax=Cannabis sativa TaxID=3483 RepID=A0A803Q4I1_CANSA
MDTHGKDSNGCKDSPSVDSKAEKLLNGVDDDSDCNSLLPPRRGGMSRKSDKVRRKVQWNDRNGDKLAEVVEFEPRASEEFGMVSGFGCWMLDVGIESACVRFLTWCWFRFKVLKLSNKNVGGHKIILESWLVNLLDNTDKLIIGYGDGVNGKYQNLKAFAQLNAF